MADTITVKGGATIILNAKVTGIPKPTISWQHADTVLESTNGTTIEKGKDEFTRITIKGSKAENGGQYMLVAENSVGAAQQTFDVVVKGTFN